MAVGDVAVLPDPEPDVETVGGESELHKEIPDSQRVLAARDGDEHTILRVDHFPIVNRLGDLSAALLEEVLGAVVGVLATDINHRWTPAGDALHVSPPEITGRTSITSSSLSAASPGMSSPSRITR